MRCTRYRLPPPVGVPPIRFCIGCRRMYQVPPRVCILACKALVGSVGPILQGSEISTPWEPAAWVEDGPAEGTEEEEEELVSGVEGL